MFLTLSLYFQLSLTWAARIRLTGWARVKYIHKIMIIVKKLWIVIICIQYWYTEELQTLVIIMRSSGPISMIGGSNLMI